MATQKNRATPTTSPTGLDAGPPPSLRKLGINIPHVRGGYIGGPRDWGIPEPRGVEEGGGYVD